MPSIVIQLVNILAWATILDTVSAQACAATASDDLGPFYLPNSPVSSVVATSDDPTKLLTVTGRVISSQDCSKIIPDAVVEVWYAGEPDSAGNFYQDEAYRAKVSTNECGVYTFQQTFPSLYPSRPILHDHFRISKGGTQYLVTQLYFVGVEEGFRTNENSQTVVLETLSDGSRAAEFDIYVSAAGVEPPASCSDSNAVGNETMGSSVPAAVSTTMSPTKSPVSTDTSGGFPCETVLLFAFAVSLLAL